MIKMISFFKHDIMINRLHFFNCIFYLIMLLAQYHT